MTKLCPLVLFENWMKVNMRDEDCIIMSRFVNTATLKSEEWPQKQPYLLKEIDMQ